MRAEAGLRVNAVLVYDSQRSELLVLRVMVSIQEVSTTVLSLSGSNDLPREAECVEGLEPTMVGLTTLIAGARDDLHCSRW